MACVKGVPSSHRACVARVGRKTRRNDGYAKPWQRRWADWYRIPEASGQIRAATIADGSPSRGRWVTAPASKPPSVVVARSSVESAGVGARPRMDCDTDRLDRVLTDKPCAHPDALESCGTSQRSPHRRFLSLEEPTSPDSIAPAHGLRLLRRSGSV